MLVLTSTIAIPMKELQFSFVRSSGPGGQNVNKVASKAVLRWNPTESTLFQQELLTQAALQRMRQAWPSRWNLQGEIVLSSQRTRDALKNKQDCLDKLKAMILKSLPEPKKRVPTKPSRGAIKRRLENKAKQAEKKRNRKVVTSD